MPPPGAAAATDANGYNQDLADELYGAENALPVTAGGGGSAPLASPPMPARPNNASFKRQLAEFAGGTGAAPAGFEVDDDEPPPPPPKTTGTRGGDGSEDGYINSEQAIAAAMAMAGPDYHRPPPIPGQENDADIPPLIPGKPGSMKGGGGSPSVASRPAPPVPGPATDSGINVPERAYKAVFYHGELARGVAEERLKVHRRVSALAFPQGSAKWWGWRGCLGRRVG